MATVLALLASARRNGYTASLLNEAVNAARQVEGVRLDVRNLHDYQFGPCTSCFACIRSDEHLCVLKDDMGADGELWQAVTCAHGLILADPVHGWGPSAMTHLFLERLYPALFSGSLNGLPFGSISCASNQGMQHLARSEICKWAFCKGFRHQGGLAVHVVHLDESMREAAALGRRVAEAAREDERDGRHPYTDQERFLAYADSHWVAYEPYIANLTRGTGSWEESILHQGLQAGVFTRPDARELAEQALEVLKQSLAARDEDKREESYKLLVRASAFWTRATWKQFLEEEVIGASQPDAYRPVNDQGRGENQGAEGS